MALCVTASVCNVSCLVIQGVVLINGGRIGFFQGDIRLLMDDMKMLRPTVFPVVPRLLNRMFDKVRGTGSMGLY